MRFTILIILFAALVFMCSCSAPPETKVIRAEATYDMNASGVSVHNIQIRPVNESAFETLENFGESAASSETEKVLKQEGLTVIRINSQELSTLKKALGDVTHDSKVAHGFILDWRDIHQQEVARGGMLITKEGIPYFIDSGYLSLLARCWVLQREDGEYSYIQVLPTWHVPDNGSSFIGKGSKPKQANIFRTLEIESLLEDDQCLVFATELLPAKTRVGPIDDGASPVRLGEAIMGAPVTEPSIRLIVIESHLMNK